MKVIPTVMCVVLSSVLAAPICFADAVFRSDGTIDLSSVSMLFDDKSSSVTVISVPKDSQGSLICQGVQVEAYDQLASDELDSLVFVPNCEDVLCSIQLLPNGIDSQQLNITLTNRHINSASATVEAGLYCWAWAQNGYFSHITSSAEAALL